MPELLIYKSKVREIVKNEGLRVSEKFYEALNTKVEELVKKAIEKAKSEGRKTLGPEHLE
ncbi:MAG: histone-like protein [Candidatus Njordarchaeales archaeon]